MQRGLCQSSVCTLTSLSRFFETLLQPTKREKLFFFFFSKKLSFGGTPATRHPETGFQRPLIIQLSFTAALNGVSVAGSQNDITPTLFWGTTNTVLNVTQQQEWVYFHTEWKMWVKTAVKTENRNIYGSPERQMWKPT